MYVILFSYKEHKDPDYKECETEEKLMDFLQEEWSDIVIHKIYQTFAELDIGIIVAKGSNPKDGPTAKEVNEEHKKEVSKMMAEVPEEEAEEIIEENEETLLSDPHPEVEEEAEEEKKEMEVQEVIDKADEAIKNAEEVMGKLRKCSKCGVNEILARNKTGICTPCQLKPKKKK